MITIEAMDQLSADLRDYRKLVHDMQYVYGPDWRTCIQMQRDKVETELQKELESVKQSWAKCSDEYNKVLKERDEWKAKAEENEIPFGNLSKPQHPRVGDIVHYYDEDAAHCPAIVFRVQTDESLDLVVFTPFSGNKRWVTSSMHVATSMRPNTWHWPEENA